MHLVVNPDNDVLYPFRDRHAAQLSCELPLANMGMIQNTGAENAAARTDDLPPVGIVLPAFVFMLHRDLEFVARFSQLDYARVHDLGRICPYGDGDRDKSQRRKSAKPLRERGHSADSTGGSAFGEPSASMAT